MSNEENMSKEEKVTKEGKMSFESLLSDENILKAIKTRGYVTPTPIQGEAIPKIKEGRDLFASAQTGTGKSAAFLLPILEAIASKEPRTLGRGPRALILAPTRELAMQLEKEATEYCQFLSKVTCISIYGGAPYPLQNRMLSRHHEILIATPGRLMDHMERGRIDFSRLEFLILDEADRMLDMGFIDAVNTIAAQIPPDRQTLMFSATLTPGVLKLSAKLLNNPVQIQIHSSTDNNANIEQRVYNADNIQHKYNMLDSLLADPTLNQAIIFTSTKRQADELADKLYNKDHSVRALHGDMNQRSRTNTIQSMHNGQTKILVATDVAARGIDVSTVTHVFNFDLPMTAEDYVHRIGRTGRAGAKGVALSFVSGRDRSLLRNVEKLIGKKIDLHSVAGHESNFKDSGDSARKPFGRFGSNKPSFDRSAPRSFGSNRSDSESRPAFKKFGSDRPAYDRPAGNNFSSDTKPAFRKFGSDRPSGSNFSSDSKPAFRKFGSDSFSSEGRSAPRKFNSDRPSTDGKPAYRKFNSDSKPAYKKFGSDSFSSDTKPAYKKFGSDRPAFGKPQFPFKKKKEFGDKGDYSPKSKGKTFQSI